MRDPPLCRGRARRSDIASSARHRGRRPARRRRLRTEGTSRSTSSGAARRSPRKRALAWSPSSPSSPRAVARTLASTTITVLAQDLHRFGERDRPSGTAAGPLQHFVHRRHGRLFDEALAQVLLQGLVGCCRSPPEHGMGLGRDTFHLDTGYGAIVAPGAPNSLSTAWGPQRRGPGARSRPTSLVLLLSAWPARPARPPPPALLSPTRPSLIANVQAREGILRDKGGPPGPGARQGGLAEQPGAGGGRRPRCKPAPPGACGRRRVPRHARRASKTRPRRGPRRGTLRQVSRRGESESLAQHTGSEEAGRPPCRTFATACRPRSTSPI